MSGEPTPSAETTRVRWVPIDELDALPMDDSQRQRIEWGLNEQRTWIDPIGD